MRQSHKGQFSTGSFKITSSSNITTVMYLNMERRSRISFIGLDFDFFAIEQIPTAICLSGGWKGGKRKGKVIIMCSKNTTGFYQHNPRASIFS